MFLRTLQDSFLFQHVTEPTRRRGNDEPSILDLIITDEDTQVSEIIYDSPLGKSDHSTLIFDFNCYMDHKPALEVYNYRKVDYESMRRELKESEWAR